MLTIYYHTLSLALALALVLAQGERKERKPYLLEASGRKVAEVKEGTGGNDLASEILYQILTALGGYEVKGHWGFSVHSKIRFLYHRECYYRPVLALALALTVRGPTAGLHGY